jgi:hypothetical protein
MTWPNWRKESSLPDGPGGSDGNMLVRQQTGSPGGGTED